MDQAIKIQKGVENHPKAVGVEAREEACGEPHPEKVVIQTGKKFYSTPLPSNYKETNLSEDLNNGMEWVFRDYVRSLK